MLDEQMEAKRSGGGPVFWTVVVVFGVHCFFPGGGPSTWSCAILRATQAGGTTARRGGCYRGAVIPPAWVLPLGPGVLRACCAVRNPFGQPGSWAPFVCRGGVIMIADLIFEDHPPP
jgi:hypothetical protein